MHDLLAAPAHAAPGTPIPEQTVDPTLVTPGPIGFVVIAVLALAVVVLIWDMMRRIRRGRVRADINEELDAQAQAAAATGATGVDDRALDARSGREPEPGTDSAGPDEPGSEGGGRKAF